MCCLLCVEIAKNNMTPLEIARAYSEIIVDDNHYSDILVTIAENYDIEVVSDELKKVYDDEI